MIVEGRRKGMWLNRNGWDTADLGLYECRRVVWQLMGYSQTGFRRTVEVTTWDRINGQLGDKG